MINQIPVLSPNLDILPFEDGLREVIPGKVTEIVEYMEYLEEWRDDSLKTIKNFKLRGEIDEFGVYFWTLWIMLQFGDYDILKRNLIYWLDLESRLPSDEPRKSYVGKDFLENRMQVEKARKRPIENFYVGQLRGAGSRLMGKCPFHQEKTPSFFIFTNDNHYHCFGCGATGDVIDYVMLTHKLTFPDAIKFLT